MPDLILPLSLPGTGVSNGRQLSPDVSTLEHDILQLVGQQWWPATTRWYQASSSTRLVCVIRSWMGCLLRASLRFAVQPYVLSTLEDFPHWLSREASPGNNNAFKSFSWSLRLGLRISDSSIPLVCLVAVFSNGTASSMKTIVLSWSQSCFYNVWKDKLLV